MKAIYLDQQFKYDGTQLKSLFAYMNYGVAGDSIVAWQGPCEISFANMADGEDVRDQSEIRGAMMLHFIVEKFDVSLFAAVALQRLLASLATDLLRPHAIELRREGDDIFLGDKKLSISIATVSPVSSLVHFAVNITNDGTPVKTLSLKDLGVDPKKFAQQLMDRFTNEVESIRFATHKVRPAETF